LNRSFEDFANLGRSRLRLHVNISPNQVVGPDFLDGLIEAYKDAGISPSRVCLELTERAFTGSAASAYSTLNRARDIGFGLAIDDFGVEYASMTNLMHVPVDCLKIDRSFISQVHVNERVQRLVEAQIAVASSMRIKLIAEGVETQEQADWLREAGCLLHQGFFYARPAEASDLAEVLERTLAMLEDLDDAEN
jgi:EAL domain-containing protein (putative c-di-GMP-specific phosphodiesterase class I)